MSVRLESPPRPAGVGMTTRASSAWAALAGVVSVAAFLASAEAVAWVTGAGGSPLFGVGSAAIDLAPAAVKNLMVSLFGTGDKVALFVLMGVLLVAITAGPACWSGVARPAARSSSASAGSSPWSPC